MEKIAKTVGLIVTVGTFAFALVQFAFNQSVEAEKPFLERKLAWCEKAVTTAAEIAVAGESPDPAKIDAFWQYYWGVMGMVEGREVTAAMIAFGDDLRATGQGAGPKALDIAHACRTELARSWSPIWGR